MKKVIVFVFAVAVSVLSFYACQDNLSPKTEFEQEYVLHCILNADTTFQTAYLARTYTVDGYNPYDNHVDPAIDGATIKLKNLKNGKIFEFTEDNTHRSDVSRYNTPLKYYFLNDFKSNFGDSVEIEAVLPNGKVLKSVTKVPPINYLFFDNSLVTYNPTLNAQGVLPGLNFQWRYIIESLNTTTSYFIPELELCYSKVENPGVIHRVKVPTRFVTNSRGSLEPVYVGVLNRKDVYYGIEAIDKILRDISAGDSNKENYIINYFEFSLLSTDKMLASFISSQEVFSGEFSVRIDAPDFTNIKNGIGIYGVYGVLKTKVFISQSFADEYGYQALVKENP